MLVASLLSLPVAVAVVELVEEAVVLVVYELLFPE